MAPTHSRAPSLPCIPDVDFDFDEKAQLLPEFDEILSMSGYDDAATIDEEHYGQMSRSRSTRSIPPRRIPMRFPSNSSGSSSTYSAIVPPQPRCVDLTYRPQLLQLPSSQKTVLESWTITYHLPTTRITARCQILGLTVWRRTEHEEGSIISVVPNPHFSQAELASTVAAHEAAVIPYNTTSTSSSKTPAITIAGTKGGSPSGTSTPATPAAGGAVRPEAVHPRYAAELEARLRALDWKVQDEIYELLGDRVQSSSSAQRRREWRVVALSCVPGGEMTDAPSAFTFPGEGPATATATATWGGPAGAAGRGGGGKLRKCGGQGVSNGAGCRRWWGLVSGEGEGELGQATKRRRRRISGRRAPVMPVTEYRLILRGTEIKTSDQGWGYYNRYSRPWRDADEKEAGERRRWSSLTGRSEKYVDF